MKELTFEQNRIFDFLVDCVNKLGAPPTIREIALRFGYKSINNVRQHLRLIAQKGYIRLQAGRARGIEIAVALEKALGNELRLPLVGMVPAGRPVTAVENVEDYITIDHNMFKGEGLFTLRVKGDSMQGAGVLDGDIAIIMQQKAARNGDIVVVLIDDETTLKRYFHHGDHITLHPENPRYEDIVLTAEKDVGIIGKMVGLIRKC
jgi:repressor LexA